MSVKTDIANELHKAALQEMRPKLRAIDRILWNVFGIVTNRRHVAAYSSLMNVAVDHLYESRQLCIDLSKQLHQNSA